MFSYFHYFVNIGERENREFTQRVSDFSKRLMHYALNRKHLLTVLLCLGVLIQFSQ